MRYGHPLDAAGRPLLPAAGSDPRMERPVELVGWIEPSLADPAWTVRVRVNQGIDLSLCIVDDSGKLMRSLASGRLDSALQPFHPSRHAPCLRHRH